MFLVCHVVSQNHVITRLLNFKGKRQSMYVTMLPRLVAIGTVVVEIQLF